MGKFKEIFMGVVDPENVDVFVTLEDIMMYIIIVCCCTPIGDVFTSLQDVLIVSRS